MAKLELSATIRMAQPSSRVSSAEGTAVEELPDPAASEVEELPDRAASENVSGALAVSRTAIDGIRPENQVRTGLPAGGGSLERTRLCWRFPANREKYRELPRFPPEQALDCLVRANIFNALPGQFPKTANREDPAR